MKKIERLNSEDQVLAQKVNEIIDMVNLLVQCDQLRAELMEMATTEIPISEESVKESGKALLNHAAESPKPDWVKEEIAAAHDPIAKINEEIGRIRGYLSRIEQFQGDEPTHAHMALSCLANVEIYLGRLTEHPSDDLLWKAFRAGADSALALYFETETPWEAFQAWLTTIPPDTLKEDRELVRNCIHAIEIHPMLNQEQGRVVFEALKRLCGTEAGG